MVHLPAASASSQSLLETQTFRLDFRFTESKSALNKTSKYLVSTSHFEKLCYQCQVIQRTPRIQVSRVEEWQDTGERKREGGQVGIEIERQNRGNLILYYIL